MTCHNGNDIEWLARINPQPHVAGGMPAPRGWLEAERVIYDHELVLFDGESFGLHVAGAELSLAAPAFVIVPPGLRHVSWNAGLQAGHRRWVHFDWSYAGPRQPGLFTFLPGHVRAADFRPAPEWVPRGIIQGPVRNPVSACNLHTRLCGLLAGGREDRLRAGPVLHELLLALLLPGATSSPAVPPAALAERVRGLLAAEAAKPIRHMVRLADLLRGTGYSYEHACRVFRRHGGLSPHVYIMRLRIERAKMLLRDGRTSVRAAAAAAGFDNPAHFSRVFRRHTGGTPTAYRSSRGSS